MRTDRDRPKPIWTWLAPLLAALPLMGWWATGLFDLDEGFYAAVVGEMLRRGDWITPHYNGRPWFEKPILLYWAAAPAVAAFGESVGPRLPSVLANLALYAMVAAAVRRWVGPRAGILAALVLAGSLLTVGIGRLMMTDALLVATMTGAWGLLFASFEPDARRRTGLRGGAGVLLGLAVLAKGPVALLLTGLVGTVYLARTPAVRPNGRGLAGWLAFAAGVAAALAAWYLPAYLANGQVFVQKFLIEQNVGRFTGGDAAHTIGGVKGLVFYLPILIAGFLPWSFFLIPAWRSRPAAGTAEGRFLSFAAVAAGTVLVFFTVSSAKLPHYILPAWAPMAVLVAAWWDRRAAPGDRPLALAGAVCAVAFAAAHFGVGWWYQASGHAEVHRLVAYARAQGGPGAVYQLPRRQADRGTGGTTLQETSHPSLAFYWDRALAQPESLEELAALPRPIWVVTRKNRLGRQEFADLAAKGVIVKTPAGVDADRYRLFQLISMERSPASTPEAKPIDVPRADPAR